ncbi:MAG TPA: hypothetical protein VME18_00680 [Acidobacteriaceae bacterium]|nr:hypothetical protein [Acidobacteriaceae bacterium]
MKGALLALVMTAATGVLLAIGTIWPVPSAVYYAGGGKGTLLSAASTPEAAVQNLGVRIRLHDWQRAYSSLANKAQFTEDAFIHDLTGYNLSLRSQASLDSVTVRPLHQSADSADVAMTLHWFTVMGPFDETRNVHLVENDGRWQVDWPLYKQPTVPPQVIPVNYLRWDVIYSGSADQWGAQDVAGPNVRIVDMRPVNRAEGVYVLGELLNNDVVPAWVTVRATLVGKDGKILGREGAFDMISHRLLPKEVTPFRIHFPNVDLSQVASIRMHPEAILISASADPVVEILNQKYSALPIATLTGQLSDQSGQTVSFAHVLSTFYDSNGNVVWVSGRFIGRALLPQTPVNFTVPVPEDLARRITSERTIVATYSPKGVTL